MLSRNNYCVLAEPVRYTEQDTEVISDVLADSIYDINTVYTAICKEGK